MPPSPAERIPPAGPDPSDWRRHGMRRLVRRYADQAFAHPKGFVLVLPDSEYPSPRSGHDAFRLVRAGRPVAAFRLARGGRIEHVATADAVHGDRVKECLEAPARLDALGLDAKEFGADNVVAFAMNVYDVFGLHVTFVPTP